MNLVFCPRLVPRVGRPLYHKATYNRHMTHPHTRCNPLQCYQHHQARGSTHAAALPHVGTQHVGDQHVSNLHVDNQHLGNCHVGNTWAANKRARRFFAIKLSCIRHFGDVTGKRSNSCWVWNASSRAVANDEHSHGFLGRDNLMQTRNHDMSTAVLSYQHWLELYLCGKPTHSGCWRKAIYDGRLCDKTQLVLAPLKERPWQDCCKGHPGTQRTTLCAHSSRGALSHDLRPATWQELLPALPKHKTVSTCGSTCGSPCASPCGLNMRRTMWLIMWLIIWLNMCAQHVVQHCYVCISLVDDFPVCFPHV